MAGLLVSFLEDPVNRHESRCWYCRTLERLGAPTAEAQAARVAFLAVAGLLLKHVNGIHQDRESLAILDDAEALLDRLSTWRAGTDRRRHYAICNIELAGRTGSPAAMQHHSPSPLGTLSTTDLVFAPPDLPLPLLADTLVREYGIVGTFKRLSGERDLNLRVRSDTGRDVLLKVTGPTEDPALIDFQIAALTHLARRDPDLPIPQMIPTLSGALTVQVVHKGVALILRLLTYVPGTPLNLAGRVNDRVALSLGRLLGRMNSAFVGFSHPAARHFMPWNTLNGLLESRRMTESYLPPHLRTACAPVIDRLASDSLPKMRDMPQSVIHYDAHSGNILIARDDPDAVCGLIDFGDMISGPILQDLATPLASLIEHGAAPVPISIALLEGFAQAYPVPVDQLPYLHDAILARLILTVELLTFRVRHDLSDAEALAKTELPRSIRALERQLAAAPHEFTRRIMDAARQLE